MAGLSRELARWITPITRALARLVAAALQPQKTDQGLTPSGSDPFGVRHILV